MVVVFIILRGAAERDWSHKNTHGTKAQFDTYYKGLSDEQLKVCEASASSDPAYIAPQAFAEQVTKEVALLSILPQSILTQSLGPIHEEATNHPGKR